MGSKMESLLHSAGKGLATFYLEAERANPMHVTY